MFRLLAVFDKEEGVFIVPGFALILTSKRLLERYHS